MAMLYRHHVEFAVGHGISVHAESPDSSDSATSIETVIVPSQKSPAPHRRLKRMPTRIQPLANWRGWCWT